MGNVDKKELVRVAAALVIFVVVMLLPLESWLPESKALYFEFALFLVPYLLAGYDVLFRAVRNIANGQFLDENFLMAVATLGAFALVLFPDSDPHMAEGAAVMLFYKVGELFEDYAVGKSRKSIADMLDIAPDYANVVRDGSIVRVDPDEVAVGEHIVVKPGERVPLDGRVVEGSTRLDTAALTGEAVPRSAHAGDEVVSGCVNLSGVVTVEVTKPFGESTVTRILELVENAAEKKARTEAFITRFARYYTPIVVGVALLLAVVPPLLFGQSWSDWIERGLIFLVVSCPCALVISVPLSFFGGIGGASRLGILVKGSNYFEVLAKVDTVVFDKTGTLTNGSFEVTEVVCAEGVQREELLRLAAHAESYSDHPIAKSVCRAWEGTVDAAAVCEVVEKAGLGVGATVGGVPVLVGNEKLMAGEGLEALSCGLAGSVVHVAAGGKYLGYAVISDTMKEDAASAVADLHAAGVKRCVMLTGDREAAAADVAARLGIDEYRSELLPADKVGHVERLLAEKPASSKLAFVGDGINDAPVLMRADLGIAMGALGSDAAIEAADVVLMDDKPSSIAKAIAVARKTMRIVWQNIVFALGIKILILILAAFGFANMWLAVFGDVGVAVLAILNAMRCLNAGKR